MTDRLEQIAQVVLLDRHLDIDILIIPKAERRIVQVPVAAGAYGPLRFVLNVVLVYLLQPGCLTCFIGRDDVARQSALLPPLADKLRRLVELALGNLAPAFQVITVAARGGGETARMRSQNLSASSSYRALSSAR